MLWNFFTRPRTHHRLSLSLWQTQQLTRYLFSEGLNDQPGNLPTKGKHTHTHTNPRTLTYISKNCLQAEACSWIMMSCMSLQEQWQRQNKLHLHTLHHRDIHMKKKWADLLTSHTLNLTWIMKGLYGLLLSIYMANARCRNPVWNPQAAARVHWTRIIPSTKASPLNKTSPRHPGPVL